jgi:hypothetical protein
MCIPHSLRPLFLTKYYCYYYCYYCYLLLLLQLLRCSLKKSSVLPTTAYCVQALHEYSSYLRCALCTRSTQLAAIHCPNILYEDNHVYGLLYTTALFTLQPV